MIILTVAIKTHTLQTRKSDTTQQLLVKRLKDIGNIQITEKSMLLTQIEIPTTVPTPQAPQADPMTQHILAIAFLIKAIALLIHTIKR